MKFSIQGRRTCDPRRVSRPRRSPTLENVHIPAYVYQTLTLTWHVRPKERFKYWQREVVLSIRRVDKKGTEKIRRNGACRWAYYIFPDRHLGLNLLNYERVKMFAPSAFGIPISIALNFVRRRLPAPSLSLLRHIFLRLVPGRRRF